MATNQTPESSSVVGAMHRLVCSLSRTGSAASDVVVKVSEEPASLTVDGGIAGTSRTDYTAAGLSSVGQTFFSGVLDKFKVFNFGSTMTSAPKETSDQKISDLNSSSEVGNGEPFPTDTPFPDPAEPIHLASRIQSLLKVLPSPSSSSPKPAKHPKQPQHDDDGRPKPPHEIQIHDTKLIAMLQSATVMNGGHHRNDVMERRVSVWSVLESLEGEGGQDRNVAGRSNEGGGDIRSEEDNVGEASGIMMYSPLTPTNLSLVEIAESGIFNSEEQQQIVDPASETAQAAGWMGMWPFSAWSTGAAGGSGDHPSANPASSILTSLPSSPSSHNARLFAQAKKRIWIPSSTKLSFQAVWWGYRIYLPPPIMDALGDKSMEYAKRAATITTALTWFFSNLPLTALPAAVRPAVLLLQTLIPYIGYIGSFVSWSWGTIQSYDTGHGVTLTATWLLPIALIPSTWEVTDFPPPSPPSSPSQSLPTPGISPSSSTLQPSSIAPLPTPPDTPPSTTTPQHEIPVQLPIEGVLSPAQSFITASTSPLQSPAPYIPLTVSAPRPVHSPNANSITSGATMMSPVQLVSVSPHLSSYSPAALPHASEPLPFWVPPPPPPSPPTIPLPEIEEETPRFGMKILGKVKTSRSKEGSKMDERKEGKGKGKARLGAITGALGGRKGKDDRTKSSATR